MILLIVLLIYHTGALSEALGHGIAGKRKMRKKRAGILQYLLAVTMWAIAGLMLAGRAGGTTQLIAKTTLDTSERSVQATAPSAVKNVVAVASLLQTSWFYAAFYGLLVVCTVIVARSIIFSWRETKSDLRIQREAARTEAVASVEDGFRILRIQDGSDPRLRIINCYQRMVLAAQRQGANITSDQTARELEAAIHDLLGIQGTSMRSLTNLFEEARYSLHPITENDAEHAQQYLLGIAEEMNLVLSI